MVSNTSHVILVMATLACAIITPAAGALLLLPSSSVFAQQQEETSLGERENIANGIVSGVLDGSGKDDEDNNNEENEGGSAASAGNDDGGTNTQIAVPITDQDQGAANLGANLAANVDVEHIIEETRTTPHEVEEPPECAVGITADKETYEPLDVVVITITNTGDVPLVFPTSLIGLEIKNVDTGEVLLLDALQVETTLQPGESMTFRFEYEDLVREIGTGLISATVTSPCDTLEEVTFTLSAPPPPPIPTEVCLTVEFVSTVVETDCFSSEEECEAGEELLRGSFAFSRIVSSCEGFETLPAGGHRCNVLEAIPEEDVPRRISCSS